jgi:ATP-dependent RNA helicase DDX27
VICEDYSKTASNIARNHSELSKQEYAAGFTDHTKGKANGSAKATSAPKRDKFAGLSRKAKRRKMAAEADKEYNDAGAVASSIRTAKKELRPRKIGDGSDPPSNAKALKKRRQKNDDKRKIAHRSVKSKVIGKGSSFASEMGGRKGRVNPKSASTEGMRAKKADAGILGGKKGGKGGGKHKGRR